MYIEADEQAMAEKNGKTAWYLARYSALGISLIVFSLIVAMQSNEEMAAVLMLAVAFFTIPGLLILNVIGLYKGVIGRRTAMSKRALHSLRMFWANRGGCLLLSILYSWLRS